MRRELVVDGYDDHARVTYGLRNAFIGLDLSKARGLADSLIMDSVVRIPLEENANTGFVRKVLGDHGMSSHVEEVPADPVSLGPIVEVLREYNPELTVGALLNVLETAGDQVRRGAMVIGGEW